MTSKVPCDILILGIIAVLWEAFLHWYTGEGMVDLIDDSHG